MGDFFQISWPSHNILTLKYETKKNYKHSIFEILGTQLDTKPNSILFTKIAISASPNVTRRVENRSLELKSASTHVVSRIQILSQKRNADSHRP